MRRRLLAVLAGIVAIGGFALVVAPTQAAWTDRGLFSAQATGGTWVTPGTTSTCASFNNGGSAVAGCSVRSLTYVQTTTGTVRTRTYTVVVDLAITSQVRRVDLDLALATASGVADPAWAWTQAAVRPATSLTTPSGYACSELPRYRASYSSGNSNPAAVLTFQFTVDASRITGTTYACT